MAYEAETLIKMIKAPQLRGAFLFTQTSVAILNDLPNKGH